MKVKEGQVRLDKYEHPNSPTWKYIVGGQAPNGEWHIRWPDDSHTNGKWTRTTFPEHELEVDELDADYSFYVELANL